MYVHRLHTHEWDSHSGFNGVYNKVKLLSYIMIVFDIIMKIIILYIFLHLPKEAVYLIYLKSILWLNIECKVKDHIHTLTTLVNYVTCNTVYREGKLTNKSLFMLGCLESNVN